MLVGFLSSRDEQRRNCLITGMPPTIPDLYSDPEVVAEYPYLSTHMQVYTKGLISRPSTRPSLYPEASRPILKRSISANEKTSRTSCRIAARQFDADHGAQSAAFVAEK